MDAIVAAPTAVRFLGVDLEVAGHVLRPREETELLARAALALIEETRDEAAGPQPRCIDMCCGSGNLAAAIAVHRPGAQVWASDLTDDAVAAARHNVERLGLDARVTIVQGDMFAPFAGRDMEESFDIVVANPPYISTRRLLDGDRAHLLATEPREAFDGGPWGLTLHQRLIADAAAFLKPGGWLGFEFGAGQGRQIAILLERSRAYDAPRWVCDEAGEERVALVRRR